MAIEARLKLRRDIAMTVAVKTAGALVSNQSDANDFTALRDTIEIDRIDAAVRRIHSKMQIRFPLRAGIAIDRFTHCHTWPSPITCGK